MKKIIFGTILTVFALALVVIPAFAEKPTDAGFNQFGYNYQARIFNGTFTDWCLAKGNGTIEPWCANYIQGYENDKLVMKWNAAWDACNEENTPDACTGAWLDNESNGMMPDGSGETWHYKFVWIEEPCTDYAPLDNGGYCIWGHYEVIFSQGTAGGEHFWDALAKPAGYGAY
jgi:hypothetical protein